MHPAAPHVGRRQVYAVPRLKTYGDLTAVTLANGGNQGKNDGGAGPDKTGFAN